VYLSVRADGVERMGAISSMVSGGRWVRRGAVFEDWPNPDGDNSPAGHPAAGSARAASAPAASTPAASTGGDAGPDPTP
jgi:hypothetical protein